MVSRGAVELRDTDGRTRAASRGFQGPSVAYALRAAARGGSFGALAAAVAPLEAWKDLELVEAVLQQDVGEDIRVTCAY